MSKVRKLLEDLAILRIQYQRDCTLEEGLFLIKIFISFYFLATKIYQQREGKEKTMELEEMSFQMGFENLPRDGNGFQPIE